MAVTVSELNEFRNLPSHARFIHTNLHMHTPATPWDWDNCAHQTRRASTVTPVEYFEALNRTSLELVAITDHNCVAWCRSLIALAKEARKNGTSRIHVLPGVEITTYEGPHLLAIFDEDRDVDEIRNMLIRLGMSGDGNQDDKVGCLSPTNEITISRVLGEVVNNLGGIIIAPHIHTKDGIWGAKEFRGRTDVLNDSRIRILAAPSGEIKQVKEVDGRTRFLYKNMDTTQILNGFGFINVSDCHRLEDFETNTTWIRMSTPCLEGVRQVIFEPELRVAHKLVESEVKVANPISFHFDLPPQVTHPYILGMAFAGGMFDGQKVDFSPHQNSIIGRNYAGKSAVLDCLRFALEAEPLEPAAQDKFTERLRAFIGDAGEIRAYIQGNDQRAYGISRILSYTRTGRGEHAKLKLEGNSDIYSLWNDEFQRESDLSITSILPVEVYPQGEVVRIKDNVSQQMRIVDALAKIDRELQSLTMDEAGGEISLYGQLVDNGNVINQRRDRQAVLTDETADISQLQTEISALEALANSPLFEQKRKWADIEVLIDKHVKALGRRQSLWTEIIDLENQDRVTNATSETSNDANNQPIDFKPTTAAPEDYATWVEAIVQAAVGVSIQASYSGESAISSVLTELEHLDSHRNTREANIDTQIQGELSDKGQSSHEGSLVDRITEKRRKLNSLLQKKAELQTLEKEIDLLETARKDLLEKYHLAWKHVREERRSVVRLIDNESAANIKAELQEEDDRSEYRELIESIADSVSSATNKIQSREAQLDAITAAVTPVALLEIVKSNDANRLLTASPSITANTARVLLSMGPEQMQQLELCTLGDRFVVSYRKDGDEHYTPIDAGLSGGEQALALVSVAMVPKHLPLIIDQPEDELGPGLITHDLVEQIRHVKSRRQMIFVTHVPNIPVLADSEQIVYIEQKVSNNNKQSIIRHRGSLDNREIVKRLLELDGGDLAFKKRSDRYLSIIS